MGRREKEGNGDISECDQSTLYTHIVKSSKNKKTQKINEYKKQIYVLQDFL